MFAAFPHLFNFLVFLVTLVQATTVTDIHRLVLRQTGTSGTATPQLTPSDVPAQCQASCLQLNSLADGSCTTPSCFCGSKISSELSTCLACILNTQGGGSSEASSCQTIYDKYASACNTAGQTVPSFKCNVANTGGSASDAVFPTASSGLDGPSASSVPNNGNTGSGGDSDDASGLFGGGSNSGGLSGGSNTGKCQRRK
ncbi:hypothetical protein NP233_g471 [Leucocoprinus birnbaumii]|uniref:Extracellular membrane protein CFEM domain-containing protein n=1 Tax=Leucocoprinus birnbaumii TaxID=56174 RepID=A0AAD5Z0A1_9AGAR|nr:hypothetical protein NP233_g471 [Leucocoprinus birnbaumii]